MYFIIDCDDTRSAFTAAVSAFGMQWSEYVIGNSTHVEVNTDGFNDDVAYVLRDLLKSLQQLRMEAYNKFLRTYAK